MPISKELISQFVKSTKDNNEQTKKETFARGWIESDGDKYYVKIEGSEIRTPVSIPTNINAEQPVTVMIKNHTATVIGNVNTTTSSNDSGKIYNSTASANYGSIEEEYIDQLWSEYDEQGRKE